jgi:hypothetical protein
MSGSWLSSRLAGMRGEIFAGGGVIPISLPSDSQSLSLYQSVTQSSDPQEIRSRRRPNISVSQRRGCMPMSRELRLGNGQNGNLRAEGGSEWTYGDDVLL